MALFYYILVCFIHIISLPFLWLCSFKQKYRHSISHRFFFPKNYSKSCYDIWIHACSFGEVRSLQALIDSIPHTQSIFLSVITQTGFLEAQRLYGQRHNCNISYLPFESLLPFFAPKCKKLLVMEAELWLMLFIVAKKNHAITKLVNARISTRSFGRYKKMRFFYSYLFSYIDIVLSQSQDDSMRLQAIGAKKILTIGNLKTTNPIIPTKCYTKPQRLIIIAASTHANEEQCILESFVQLKEIWQQSSKLQKQDSNITLSQNNTPNKLNPTNKKQQDIYSSFNTNSSLLHCADSKQSLNSYLHNPLVLENQTSSHAPISHSHATITKDSSNVLFIIVPRHPERFDEVARLCKSYFKTLRFTQLQESLSECLDSNSRHIEKRNSKQNQESFLNPQYIAESSYKGDGDVHKNEYNTESKPNHHNTQSNPLDFDNVDCEVLLIDTMGELINLYAIGDIVILGGGFEKIGGHNPLEVAAFNNILLSGKEIFNQYALFQSIYNYYLLDCHEIPNLLQHYKELYKSCINQQHFNNMLHIIMQ